MIRDIINFQRETRKVLLRIIVLILCIFVIIGCDTKTELELIEDKLIKAGYEYDYENIRFSSDERIIVFEKEYFQVIEPGYNQVKYYYDSGWFFIEIDDYCSWHPIEGSTYNPCNEGQIIYFTEIKSTFEDELKRIGLSIEEVNLFLNSKSESDRITS